MKRTALVLAAHGSHGEPAVNAQLSGYADALAGRNLFDEVAAAFHQGAPAFSTILDQLTADDVTVVPVMTSVGFYSDTVLPRELARNRRYPDVTLRRTAPLGTHASIIDLMADRVRSLYKRFGFQTGGATPSLFEREDRGAGGGVSLAVVGHGTPRHALSRNATRDVAAWLGRMRLADEVVAAFLDDEPSIETLLDRVHHSTIIVEPFLIGVGPHAMRDVPRSIGLTVTDNASPPFFGRVGERTIVCDAPIGSDPRIVDLIADLAFAGCVNGTAQPCASTAFAETER